MRRVGALFVTGVVLAGSAMAGCATSEPAERAGASASPSPSSQVDVESGAATPEPSDSNSPTSPGAPARESTGNGETPWPASGSSPRPVKSPRPAGVSLSELAAMLIDPLEEASKAGIGIRTEYPYQMSTGEPALLGPENFASPPPGLVLGYSWVAGGGERVR